MKAIILVFGLLVFFSLLGANAFGDFSGESNLAIYKIPYDTIELDRVLNNTDDPLMITYEFKSKDKNITVGIIHNQRAILFDNQGLLEEADRVGYSIKINGHVDHENGSLYGHKAVTISENHTYVTSLAYPNANEILTIYSLGKNHTSDQHAAIVAQIQRSLGRGNTKYM